MKLLMILFHLVLLCLISEGNYRLYHSHYPISNNDHDCLYRFESSSNGLAYHLVPYCVRHNSIYSKKECFGTKYTFQELRFNNVTSQQLWEWFAPIDIIDDYAVYLLTELNNDINEQVYCNCSMGLSFGAQCQYRFTVGNERSSFDEIVNITLMTSELEKNDLYWMNEQNSTTCYTYFNCTTYTGFCLDWREINDGFVHCTNGIDEEHFVTMELSDCDEETEYRCRNGLCIPRSFLLDRTFDCPDWYDEPRTISRKSLDLFVDLSRMCSSKAATAECEEHKLGLNFFPCGNGQRLAFQLEEGHTCSNLRDAFMLKTLFRPYYKSSLEDPCSIKMMCLFNILCLFEPCQNGIRQRCDELLSIHDEENSCLEKFFFPPGPFLFPFIRLLYTSQQLLFKKIYPEFLCWNRSICNIYQNLPTFKHDGFDCVETLQFDFYGLIEKYDPIYLTTRLVLIIQSIFSHCTHQKTHSELYTCNSRLSISDYRVLDVQFNDCFPWSTKKEDEAFKTVNHERACQLPDRFNCSNTECVPRQLIQDDFWDCLNKHDEFVFSGCTDEFDCQYLRGIDPRKEPVINYQEICDGFEIIEMFETVGNFNDTDETDCEMWPCETPYNHCNGIWNRPNGCDELNCQSSQKTLCANNEHSCAYFNSTSMGCLSVTKAGDGHIDCLFGTDERETLLTKEYHTLHEFSANSLQVKRYYRLSCWNYSNITIMPADVCDRTKHCPLGDDELFCHWHQHSTCESREFTCKNGTCISKDKQWCNGIIDCAPEGEDERLCDILKLQSFHVTAISKEPYLPFSFDHFIPIERRLRVSKYTVQCHRGIVIHNVGDNIDECLCPPSYHGAYCEQQSERLTIFYRVDRPSVSDRHSVYQLVFYLLDGHGQILTYETMIYTASAEQFSLKQLIYLNYPRFTQNYSMFHKKFVRIDAYRVTNTLVEPTLLSWLYFVQFSDFLPVTRLAALLHLEGPSIEQTVHCRNFTTCGQHGVCQVFLNSGDPFCRCEDGWFGSMCDQRQSKHLCTKINCTRQLSKCVVYNNHAFCLCTLGRMGPKCEIPFDTCSSVKCENNGTCISLDERTIPQICICPIPYFGNRCQYTSAELKVNISSTLSHIPALTIHFLHSPENLPGILLHRDFFFFRNVHPNTQLVINNIGQTILPPIIFAEIFHSDSFDDSYYLLVLSNTNRSHLTTIIRESHRCPHVNEYLNSSLINMSPLKRVKFYHLYIKNVKCFYDEIYMCLINKNGFHDCLIYNHDVANCIERDNCQNGGRCLQRKKLGQLDYMCICPRCISGTFCQFRMNEFSITLDTLLNQMIVTDVSLHAQPIIIKVVLGLCSLMFVIGLVSNVCSFITFRNIEIQKIGCGHYLLILSIANQLTVSIFVARIVYLIYSQIVIIKYKNIVYVSCRLFDFILQVSISFCDWLHACIACERMVSALKGVRFNKRLSVYMVKIIVPLLLLKVILTSIHHVFTHDLIDDPRSNDRQWCVIQYKPEWLRIYEIGINIFNNFISFFINLISGIVLLVALSIGRRRVAVTERYRTIFISQMIEHKDLLIAPVTMIIAKLPLLIVSMVTKCISERWQYVSLTAYFLSLIPLISTFLTFVWPSDSYMSKFKAHFRYFKKTKRNN